MRVLHIINSLEAGGAQKLLADILPRLNASDSIDISVAVFKISDSENEGIISRSGIEIININSSPLSIHSVRGLIPLMKKADIVHVHLFAANYAAVIANMFAGKPLIFTEHSTHNKRRNHKWLRPIEKIIYSQFDSVACISLQTASRLSDWIGHRIADKRIVTIPNGIDIDRYKDAPSTSPAEMFGRDGIPILMVSRFVESKDQPTLIRALQLVNNKDTFIVFAGDGPLREKCELLAKESGVSDRVLFLGTRNDVPRLIKASRIGVQSSNWEGFGLTAVEMMAGGLPVIASEVDGLRQVVDGAGMTFPAGDHKALAACIDQLLDTDTHAKVSALGMSRAMEYSIKETSDAYARLYRSLYSH